MDTIQIKDKKVHCFYQGTGHSERSNPRCK